MPGAWMCRRLALGHGRVKWGGGKLSAVTVDAQVCMQKGKPSDGELQGHLED